MSKRDEQIARMKGLMTYGIVSESKKKLFSSVEDFFRRMSCQNLSKFAVDCLIKYGAFSIKMSILLGTLIAIILL